MSKKPPTLIVIDQQRDFTDDGKLPIRPVPFRVQDSHPEPVRPGHVSFWEGTGGPYVVKGETPGSDEYSAFPETPTRRNAALLEALRGADSIVLFGVCDVPAVLLPADVPPSLTPDSDPNDKFRAAQVECSCCDTCPVVGGTCRCGREKWDGAAYVKDWRNPTGPLVLDPYCGGRLRQYECTVCDTTPGPNGTCRCGQKRWRA